jgi:hypothetical protein
VTIVAAWLLAATGGADAQTTFAELQQRVKPGSSI